jgi:endoglucanase
MKPARTLSFVLMLLLVSPLPASSGNVAVDQAGYTPSAAKFGLIGSRADSFRVVNAATGESVFRGEIRIAMRGDKSTGMDIWKADFSALRTPGEYVIHTSAGDSSEHFIIADTVYDPVFHASLKGFYYQRCGTTLATANAGPYARTQPCHMADGVFHASAAKGEKQLDVTGGWHDAGDYGKYVVNAGITTGTLLAAYEWFPAKFAADNLNIPESGNGVPDILDEARFELLWLLKVQDHDGGAFFKVTHEKFEGFISPEADNGARFIYPVSTTATGNFVAVMARASRVFSTIDAEFASRCLSAARAGWHYLQKNPSIIPEGGFRNPPGTVTGEYGDGNDRDERLWAAAELYLADEDMSAHHYFLDHYTSGGVVNSTMWWMDVNAFAQLTYLRGSRPGIDATVQGKIRESLLAYCRVLLSLHDLSGFGTAIELRDYIWGSNGQVLNNGLLLILGNDEAGNPAFLQAALDQLHYVLGVNAHGQSFVTGVGAKHTMHPHHRPSGSDGIVEPLPGLISGGPNHNVKQDPALASHFSRTTPPALCYIDDEASYASNEICINWNAPLVFVAGYFH